MKGLIVIIGLALAFGACGGKESKKSEGDKTVKKGEGDKAEGGGQMLGKLGFKAELPAGAKVTDTDKGVTVKTDKFEVTIEPATDAHPKTWKAAKAALGEDQKYKGWDRTGDAWALKYKKGDMYTVQVRGKVRDKADKKTYYWCVGSSKDLDNLNEGKDFCQELLK